MKLTYLKNKKKLKIKVHSWGIPKLISEIEIELTNKLKFKEHILSINNARNCFVHRNGIVVPHKDINNKEANLLEVKWIKYLFSINNNGEMKELSEGIRINNNAPVLGGIINKKESFKPHDKIDFSYKQYMEVVTTCFFFGQEIVDKLTTFLIETKNSFEK